ncbi:MAG: sugar phosphate isomerase/epimerase [Myxococcales bacterium]|nr:sugar phosphate isomerase/epimerase [Myxococcales bacterium]
MRLGYNTNGFAHHALPDTLTILAELGYRGVALTLDHAQLDPYAPGFVGELAATRARLADLNLLPVVETGARFLLDPRRKHRPTLLDVDAAARAHRADFIARAIAAAVALGAPVVSLWSGTADDAATTDALDERLATELTPLCRRAADAGVVLALEPEPGMHVESLADWARVHARVAHPALALTLDVGHAHLTEPDGAVACVARVASSIANVHLEGMRRGAHEHLTPGEGDLDLAAVVAALTAVGYVGPANLELSRHSHDAVATARRAREFFRRLGL